MRDKTWFTERIGKAVLRSPKGKPEEAREFFIGDEQAVTYLVSLGDNFTYEETKKFDPLEDAAPVTVRRISTPENAGVCISCEG